MKKIFGALVAAGMATSVAAQAQEEKKDSILFWKTTDFQVMLDFFAGELGNYKGKYDGNVFAVFGLRVNGAYDNLRWNMEPCSQILQDQGDALRVSLHAEFNDENKVLDHYWLSKKGVRSLDMPSIHKSIDKAVDKAVDACAPKIM